MKTIAIATQKGGAGKTTSAAAIAQAAAYMGKRALLIDTDAQASASLIYGADVSKPGIHEILTGKRGDVQHTTAGDIITPGRNVEQFRAPDTAAGNRLLYEALQQVAALYDVCIIDTAPGLSAMLIQSLSAADTVLIPASADSMGLAGLTQITGTIAAVKKICNPALTVSGVFLTRHGGRTILKRQYTGLFEKQCNAQGLPFASTVIREAVAIQEAQAMRRSLYKYAPDSKPARDYLTLIKETKLF